ncbi:putative dehydrogenase [Cryobacterium mesophilum]|uniref:Gfo/Idh/MocA family oxidoreductase n=1 Tax=Terrimesophilobacter mesophilus TaxID=433647 RepID=A0A4R8V8Z2_9MICO|nr:Gfo/Idh/MocA family oxidoreductase [Terrimesophilobacter mesophilus]MBB5632818.1 putative dehydrogenase [Terrimesophilobacter mesophilus]TFB79604.1 Gfo/Idh/MocA family oxidoreductase [Terrimesophilobacter mesophilus]
MNSTHREPSSADALRLAVVGVGQRADILRHAIAAGEKVVAAVDPSEEGRAKALELFGSDVALLESHEQLTTANNLDAAFVLTPDWTHARIAIDLLEAGIPVYLEKPLAISITGADETLAAARSTGTALYIGHNFRHSPVVVLMRDIIERGEIGEVKAVWCRHFVGNGADYYFKDWHADRSKTNSLLLQKASHDIDVIHYLSGGYARRVVGMGGLVVYGSIDDRADRTGQRMTEWFSMDNWPPLSNTGLNPVVDVEDLSMLMMELDNGVQASYQQAHFTPDYWRNYTVIGTEGRLENFGDTSGGVVKVWNRRHEYAADGDAEYPIAGEHGGHVDADAATVGEFLLHLRTGAPTQTSPVAARYAVAVGDLAAQSLRNGSVPVDIPPLDPELAHYFEQTTVSSSTPDHHQGERHHP